MKVQYGDFTIPFQAPTFQPVRRTSFDADGIRTGYTEVWVMEGQVKTSGPEDTRDQIDELRDAFAVDGLELKLLTDSGTLLHKLDPTLANKGPNVTVVAIPEPRRGLFVTNFTYRIEVEAFFPVPDSESGQVPSILENTFTFTFDTDRNGIVTRTKRGSLRTKEGVSAKLAAESQDPGTPSGFFKISQSISHNTDDTEADYSFVHKELWKEFPTGVTDGQAVTLQATIGGVRSVTLSGRWVGDGAESAVEEFRPQGVILTREDVSENPYDGSFSFTFAYIEPAGDSEEFFFREEITIDRNFHQVNHKIKKKGVKDYKQITANPDSVLTQTGERKHLTKFQEAPDLIGEETDLTRHSVRKVFEYSADGTQITGYITRWTFVFEIGEDTDEADFEPTKPGS